VKGDLSSKVHSLDELPPVTILDTIVQHKRIEIEEARRFTPDIDLERLVETLPPARDFTGNVRKPGMRVIAEVKKASPSAGVIREDFDPVVIAGIYEKHRADCISVLTDSRFFQGELRYLTAIHGSVQVPLLRKDFILDRYQLVESRIAGADAVLLIAEILPGDQLKTLFRQATDLGLHVLVELHDADQLDRVIGCGATLIGINNRDLRTFQICLEHTLELLPKIPARCLVVSESGIRTRADVERLEEAGVKAILVGESLMRADDIGAALDALRR